ncbi:hypothetical protein V5P93_003925 [Actinokineospora auranticolor]|uniref:Tetratricopeptide repeat protein n=1 Tax=Actinokineospora auranticolor TaxID=155976 RepID=A0A2S6GLW2_9PSEU|nr:hypothetical protein [Actinokineospora auranticolor]PPK66207.1 hypothetical protein CLV40_111171 [Actinokineospora auranticolor]
MASRQSSMPRVSDSWSGPARAPLLDTLAAADYALARGRRRDHPRFARLGAESGGFTADAACRWVRTHRGAIAATVQEVALAAGTPGGVADAVLLGEVSSALTHLGDPGLCLRAHGIAVSAARRVWPGDRRWEMDAGVGLCQALVELRAAEATRACTDVLRVAEGEDAGPVRAAVLDRRATAHLLAGEHDAAEADVDAALAAHESSGPRSWGNRRDATRTHLTRRARLLSLRGEIACARGDLDAALAASDEALAVLGDNRKALGHVHVVIGRAEALLARGDLAAADTQVHRAVASARPRGCGHPHPGGIHERVHHAARELHLALAARPDPADTRDHVALADEHQRAAATATRIAPCPAADVSTPDANPVDPTERHPTMTTPDPSTTETEGPETTPDPRADARPAPPRVITPLGRGCGTGFSASGPGEPPRAAPRPAPGAGSGAAGGGR